MQAQEALKAAGYHLGEPDGKPGPATTAALKKFQGDRHLPVTGKLDSITLAALGVGKGSDPAAAERSDLILADAVNALVHTVDPGNSATGNSGGDQRGSVSHSRSDEGLGKTFLRKFRSAHHLHFNKSTSTRKPSGSEHPAPEF